MTTIKFYNQQGYYLGWKKFTVQNVFLELKNWIRSGNYAYIGILKINSIKQVETLRDLNC